MNKNHRNLLLLVTLCSFVVAIVACLVVRLW